MKPRISIVICSIDDRKFESVASMYARLLEGVAFELIRIRDAKGLSEGYNRGVASCTGELIVFSHDDLEFLAPDFAEKLLSHMRYCDVIGVCGTRLLTGPVWFMSGPPYIYGQIASSGYKGTDQFGLAFWSVPSRRVDQIQALDGVFLCVRREVVERISFDETTFGGFHLYDIDFTYRAHLAGFRVSVACDLFPVHQSLGNYGDTWAADAQALMRKFEGILPARAQPDFRSGGLVVPRKENLIAAMTPPHWDQ